MVIQGGHRLEGRTKVGGAKNAIGPLLASCVLLKGTARFTNVPRITDVFSLIEILESMGASVRWTDEHSLEVNTADATLSKLDRRKMKSMRFSILLLGPMLARFKRVDVPEPGGCIIGSRPIDTHLEALQALGAKAEQNGGGAVSLEARELTGGVVVLREFSVTATENLVMAAVTARGKTSIRLAAAEPHVQELCRFLVRAGAKIKGIGTHDLEITGVKSLTAPKTAWRVMPDTIEVGTFAVAAALTHSEIEIIGVEPSHVDAILVALNRVGVKYELTRNSLKLKRSGRYDAFKLQTMIYPGFPTDLQAPFGLLATQCHGTSLIHDPLFEARLGYINELVKMGANAVIADPHRVVVTGPTVLRGTEIRSLDLRAGATMVLAGLAAEGETTIHDAEILDRGYEDLDGRLVALGADIRRESDRV